MRGQSFQTSAMRMIAAVLYAGGISAIPLSGASAGAPMVCIAEGSPADLVANRIAAAGQAGPQAANVQERWTATATDGGGIQRGEPLTLTWSVVPDGTAIDGSQGLGEPDAPSDLEAFLTAHYGVESVWLDLIQQALDGWSNGPGIVFVYEPNDDMIELSSGDGIVGVRADIRIGGHPIDDMDRGLVAYAFFPDGGGDVVVDTFEDTNSFNANQAQFLNVLSHEVGHAIGMGHTCPVDRSKLMEPIITTNFFGPQFDDLLGAHRSYGDLEEENDNDAEAADIGLEIDTTTIDDRLALDGSSDEDWFIVPAGSFSRVTIDLDPAGTIYPFGSTPTGSCAGVSTSNFDPTLVQDLSLEIIDYDGTTTIRSADATSAGGSESLTDVPVSSLGGFIVVSGSGTNDTQAYELLITLVPAPSQPLTQAATLLTLAFLARRRSRAA